jgi:hypothetical protein
MIKWSVRYTHQFLRFGFWPEVAKRRCRSRGSRPSFSVASTVLSMKVVQTSKSNFRELSPTEVSSHVQHFPRKCSESFDVLTFFSVHSCSRWILEITVLKWMPSMKLSKISRCPVYDVPQGFFSPEVVLPDEWRKSEQNVEWDWHDSNMLLNQASVPFIEKRTSEFSTSWVLSAVRKSRRMAAKPQRSGDPWGPAMSVRFDAMNGAKLALNSQLARIFI